MPVSRSTREAIRMASSAFFPHSIAAMAACAPDPQASLAAAGIASGIGITSVYSALEGFFWELIPGDNEILFVADSGSTSATRLTIS